MKLRLSLIVLALLTACGGAGVVDTGVKLGDTTHTVDTTGTGTVQRTTLTAQVSFNLADSSVTSVAGISLGGLTVSIQRVGSADPIKTAVTNSSGVATFDQLLEGQYTVNTDRMLTATEQARLNVADRDVSLLAAGTSVNLLAPGRTALLPLNATRRGSLILSEFYNYTPTIANASYPWANYFEVYNNSDTTIYLDGIAAFRDPFVPVHLQWPTDPCATVNATQRLDPDGIWASSVYTFPGTGREHPLLPGQGAVVATDAADQRSSGTVDISGAQFEFIGTSADADNPSAANMVRVLGNDGALGRGINLNSGSLYGLALPGIRDTSQLPGSTVTSEGKTFRVYRIPKISILDVVGMDVPQAILEGSGAYKSGLRPCDPWTLPQWDRDRARSLHPLEPQAVRRKALETTSGGRLILQRTGTGSRDFELGEPLKRSLAK
ncbi:MAG: hypothetical protein ABJC26_02425 [Gemmatimonadaceae bacterium]